MTVRLRSSLSATARMRRAWGATPPDWVAVLAEACERESQAGVAGRIGYSPSVVNQILGRKYRGNLARVERAVRLEYLPERVACPVLGAITTSRCSVHQRRPSRANVVLAELARTCPRCPNREDFEGGAGDKRDRAPAGQAASQEPGWARR